MTDPIQSLKWRYAVKQFSDRRIPDAEFKLLQDALALAPSSYGQQPYRIVVVEDPQVRQRLVEKANGKDKVALASHLLVFAIETRLASTKSWV